MTDVFLSLTGPQLIGLVAVAGGLLVAPAGVAAPFLSLTRRVESLNHLKRDLAAAGFSAEDIERVVRAGA
jgi:hypothetical protein